jgi:murein DD-endopeptidase MepM/ murein hydrolase activator NlpD
MWPCWRPIATVTDRDGRAAKRRAGYVLLLALGILIGLVSPVLAGGLVLDARPAGDAGPQLDAAIVSALPVARAERAAAGSVYVVQSGDTLAAIAARLEVDTADLAARNGVVNPDRIAVGQVLKVGGTPLVALPLADGGPLIRVQLWPWPPVQGQTLAIWLQAREPVTFTVRFGDQAYPVVTEGRGGWTLMPIESLTQPGAVPLTITAGSQTLRLQVPLGAGSFPSDHIPASAAAPILSQPVKVRTELARLREIFGKITPDGWTARSRFRSPLDGEFPHTSPYGSRRVYGDSPALSTHEGEDFSAAAGTPVYAPAAGTVVLAEPLFVRGNAIVLDHGHGVYSGYWHLSELAVRVGERVLVGQRLGAVGSTGLSTGAHLHWELHVAGAAVDPLQWMAPQGESEPGG